MAKLFSELFSINGSWLWPPDGYQEEPVPVVGYNLSGEPIRQGYPAITFTWSFMKQEHLSALLAQFKPNKPRVKIQYINREKGAEARNNGLIAAYGMMHEPVIGARQIVYYNNIAVKFSHIEETAPALSDNFDLSMTGWTVGNVSSGATARFTKDTARFVSAPDSGMLRFDGSARANDRADAWNPNRYRLIDTAQIAITGQMRSSDESVKARLLIIWFDAKGNELSREVGGAAAQGETGWEQRTAIFTVPVNAVYYSVGIRAFATQANADARINVDDFAVDTIESS